MKRGLHGLYEAAELARAIVALARDPERDAQEFSSAMTAIAELGVGIHDRIDYELRGLNCAPGIGYACRIRRELDAEPELPE